MENSTNYAATTTCLEDEDHYLSWGQIRGKPLKAIFKTNASCYFSTSSSSTSSINRGKPPKAYLDLSDSGYFSTSPSLQSSRNSFSHPSPPSTTVQGVNYKPIFTSESFVNPLPMLYHTHAFSKHLVTRLALPDEKDAGQSNHATSPCRF